MRFLSDKSIEKLRSAAVVPDLSGTRYALVEFLARGGMGAVYLAEDQTLNRRVALKILEMDDPQGELAARLVREARVLAQLEHPGIVPVHDVGTIADGRVFYAMKYVEGIRLDRYLGSVAALSERLRLFLRVCDAVSFAHSRGILHRDLKPSNVMIGAFGEVLVMDWGLAKILGPKANAAADSARDETQAGHAAGLAPGKATTQANAVTGVGIVMGTPGYMSPEQASGKSSSLDVRSDIFSLGKLLEFMVNGSGEQRISRPARALRAVYEKAASANPGSRYPSVSAVAEDISRFLDDQPITAYRETLWERSQRFYHRFQIAILLITVYLVMRSLFILYPRH
jgi:eukaryotic-like serine/threonine-protein kinase